MTSRGGIRRGWRASRKIRALKTVIEIKTSIAALHDEDLLDLQDIFSNSPGALETFASAEMRRRNLNS